MSYAFRFKSACLSCGLAAFLAGTTGQASAAPFGGALYETFGSGGVSALDLAAPGYSLGNLGISAGPIVAGGSTVYFASGDTIYTSSDTLNGLTAFHSNNAAPAGLALDAADGILYETFGALSDVSAINLANPSTGVGFLSISATSIVAGGGKVYFASGDTIYQANPNLSGLTVFHANNAGVTGLALDAADGILYETLTTADIVGIELANPSRAVGALGLNATDIVFGDGTVYFDSGDTIYETNPDLGGLTAFSTTGTPTTGLAFLPPAPPSPVPEPSAFGLVGVGLLGVAGLRRRRTFSGAGA